MGIDVQTTFINSRLLPMVGINCRPPLFTILTYSLRLVHLVRAYFSLKTIETYRGLLIGFEWANRSAERHINSSLNNKTQARTLAEMSTKGAVSEAVI